ncbi:hypothetical protein KJ969_04955, partial [Patescibacteria group bacterium]|nr:hypothetical protein [Patescibacteria group bacterium]
MFKNWLKKHHILLILGIGGVVFFILFSYLNFFAPLRFNSPDETANFFFAKQLAEEGEIWYFEPANYYLEGLVHPRSVQAVDALLVPGGFLGLIVIFGYIGKIMGANLMIFLTPFFAVLAGWAWYGLIKKYFDKWVGLVSVFFAWLCPAWWYYTARSMFPNVLFTSLLMIGAYLALGRPFAERRDRMKLAKNWFMQNLDLWLAGLFLGLAVFVRPAEVFWIGAAMLVIILLNLKKINWPALIMFFAVMAIVLCPMFFLNNALYGSPLRTGYQAAISDVETDTAALGTAASDSWGAGMKNYLDYVLPFGFHPKNILNN